MSLLGLHVFAKAEVADPRVMHTCAISRGRTESKFCNDSYRLLGGAYYFRSKSALGWLANKGERWMPRLEKAMKDVA